MLVFFLPILWTVATLPSLWLPPLPKLNVQYIQTLCGCGGVLMLSCVVDHILQELISLFLTRFTTCKISTPPQTKTPVKTTFRDWCLYSSFVHAYSIPYRDREMESERVMSTGSTAYCHQHRCYWYDAFCHCAFYKSGGVGWPLSLYIFGLEFDTYTFLSASKPDLWSFRSCLQPWGIA